MSRQVNHKTLMPPRKSTFHWRWQGRQASLTQSHAESLRVSVGGRTCQEEAIVGTAPLFNASRNDWVIPASIGPFIMVAPTCLGLVLSNTNLVNASRPDLNSGLNLSNCMWWVELNKSMSQKTSLQHSVVEDSDAYWCLIELLKFSFTIQWPHKGETITIREKSTNWVENLVARMLIHQHHKEDLP